MQEDIERCRQCERDVDRATGKERKKERGNRKREENTDGRSSSLMD